MGNIPLASCTSCDSKCVRYIVPPTMGLAALLIMRAQEAALASKITGQSLHSHGNLKMKHQISEKNANELIIGAQRVITAGSVSSLQDKQDHPGLDFSCISTRYLKSFEKRVVPQNCNPYIFEQENPYDVIKHFTPVMCAAA